MNNPTVGKFYAAHCFNASDYVAFAKELLIAAADVDRDAAYAEDAEREKTRWTLDDVQPGRQYTVLPSACDYFGVRTFVGQGDRVLVIHAGYETVGLTFSNAQEAVDWYNTNRSAYRRVAP